ncbi:hypothetical protein N9J02_01040 [bacterium]|jgi:small nuclear ribonucleoprotein (snRNP)-like protein|nr:hypothetical protein [bacterium]|tara:strand:- start:895 stop:1188 length:294 start_codon:yes stop_codon:yes gene_type:complete
MYTDILKAGLGKVVSVKTTAGIELIATLMGYDDKNLSLTLSKPRLVVVAEESIAVVPYTFTSKSEEVYILREQYLSVDIALENSSTDYLKLLEDSQT